MNNEKIEVSAMSVEAAVKKGWKNSVWRRRRRSGKFCRRRVFCVIAKFS